MNDRIRDLEIALIAEAQAARRTLGGVFNVSALAKATDALTFGCPECNAGGHTCPGDGNSIPHGAGSCGEHGEPAPGPEWIASTFLHIEQGDRLRIGQDEATVLSVFKSTWHADTSDSYRPKPWEHVELYADLGFGRSPFPTDTAVEILCDEQRKAKLALSHAGLKPEEL